MGSNVGKSERVSWSLREFIKQIIFKLLIIRYVGERSWKKSAKSRRSSTIRSANIRSSNIRSSTILSSIIRLSIIRTCTIRSSRYQSSWSQQMFAFSNRKPRTVFVGRQIRRQVSAKGERRQEVRSWTIQLQCTYLSKAGYTGKY